MQVEAAARELRRLGCVPFAGAAAKLIEGVAGRLVDAFRVRADQVYGKA